MSEHVRIVMVEDDEGHARLIEKNIRRAGVRNEIIGFENGTKAVEFLFGSDGSGKVNSGNALLIMLDLNLPDMSGVDILKRVKENEHLKRTPVVVLTTTDDEVEIKRCYDLGANVLAAELFFRGALFERAYRRWSFAPAAAVSTGAALVRYLLDPLLPHSVSIAAGATFYLAMLGAGSCWLLARTGALGPSLTAAAFFFVAYRLLAPR